MGASEASFWTACSERQTALPTPDPSLSGRGAEGGPDHPRVDSREGLDILHRRRVIDTAKTRVLALITES